MKRKTLTALQTAPANFYALNQHNYVHCIQGHLLLTNLDEWGGRCQFSTHSKDQLGNIWRKITAHRCRYTLDISGSLA